MVLRCGNVEVEANYVRKGFWNLDVAIYGTNAAVWGRVLTLLLDGLRHSIGYGHNRDHGIDA
jgi:hypothetical protein